MVEQASAKFRARARTVDMLGRQQIAGIPTAISELFKNAHDAYADRVEVDYYRADGLFVLRDDGLGMARGDIEHRWLAIGTESKLGQSGLSLPPVDPSKPRRAILGEKGIGRLAIAAIGPQVLIMTRARREGQCGDLVACFIHWGLFECPGVDLDEIVVPLRVFPGGELPSRQHVVAMVAEVRENLLQIGARVDELRRVRIEAELAAFDVDPQQIDGFLGSPSLADGSGTHFVIKPASELLPLDIGEEGDERASNLTKALLGFTNTMTPDHLQKPIATAFRDHRSEAAALDLIAEGGFFTPDEFANADHQIVGEFDAYGQFRGTVAVYGDEHPDHVITWPGARGRPAACGPFRFRMACIQGQARESTVPLEEWARLSRKTNRIGGLYVYRDGIRMLPYGDTDFDWLEIEKRRSKSYGYYYFSYRNVFGAVEIGTKTNPDLNEKAGREGFRANRAYRDLRAILMHFLEQVAADFFREGGTYTEGFQQRKAELDRLERARRAREQQVSVRRTRVAEQLTAFFSRVEAHEPERDVLAVTEHIDARLREAAGITDPGQAAEALLDIEADARRRLAELRNSYQVARPRGIGLGRSTERDWESYEEARHRLEDDVFGSAASLVEGVVTDAARRASLELDRRRRVQRALNDLQDEAKRAARAEASQTRGSLDRVTTEVRRATGDSIAQVERVARDVLSEFAALDMTTLDDAHVVEQRRRLEQRIEQVREQEERFLQYLRAQIEAVTTVADGAAQIDQMEALEQRTLSLEERAEADLQLTQLGMAIEIINHEFTSTIRGIRENLGRLKAWADVNENLRDLHQGIRAGFDHLDGYLTLFTPLHRRLYRQKVDIKGDNIHRFLSDLFAERLKRHGVDLVATKTFRAAVIVEFPSSVFPVFVNLVDNAIYWLRDRQGTRRITLDAEGNALLVSDSGPGIPERDRDAVFEMGFSRKPGGRGLGLFISREGLKGIGYQLLLDPLRAGVGATFRIEPLAGETEQAEGDHG